MVGGFGRFRGESICVIGHEKGSTTESRLKHNFGMARPEGYRKAVRLMDMAEQFGPTEFLGYDTETAEGQVLAMVVGGQSVEPLVGGSELCVDLGFELVLPDSG